MSAPKILEARALEPYRIRLKFHDGTTGEVDLSDLAGKGVFTSWNEYENFKNLSVEDGRRLTWPDEIDIDADSLSMRMTGKSPEEVFPALKEDPADA